MPEFSEIALFAVVLLKVSLYGVAGGVIMGAVDAIEHLRGKNISKKLYLLALAVTLLLGVFVEWQTSHNEIESLKNEKNTLVAVNASKDSLIASLNQSLHEKEKYSVHLESKGRDLEMKVEEQTKEIKELSNKQTEKTRRKFIREELGSFVSKGQRILARCEHDPTLPKEDYDKWVVRVETFLRTHLDESFVARFQSGFTAMTPMSVPSEAHRTLWERTFLRVTNLRAFLDTFPL